MSRGWLVAVMSLAASVSMAATIQTLDISASILQGDSSLLINGGPLAVGSIRPSITNQYHVTDSREAEFFAANGPWHIRVCTTNANNLLGMVSASEPNRNIILKIWQPSMGPKPDGGTGSNGVPPRYSGKVYPDPDDNPCWWRCPADESQVCWAIVQDDNVANPVDYTKIAWSAGSAAFNPAPAESEVSGIDFRFGFETSGHKSLPDYRTTLIFELIIEP